MGNEAIISDKGLQNAQRVSTLELSHMGTVTLLRLQQKQCFLKVLSFSDSFLMEQHLRRLKIRVSKFSGCPHVLNVYQVRKQERSQLCTNNYQLHIYLQYFDETLAQCIEKHLEQRRNFSEDELYCFIGKAVDSLIYIQDNGLRTIQLDADTIIFSGEQVKVLDSGVASSKEYYRLLTENEKNIRNQEPKIYLAPELLKELKELNYDPYVSPKADIFSLGMLLLQMITLEPMYCYYNYNKASMDYESLIHRLSRISHSLPLKTLLAEMLQQDPQARIGLVSLKEKLQRIKNPCFGEQSIVRSRSSKMLKDILSNSRRSGSISRQSEAGFKNQSKEAKNVLQQSGNYKKQQQKIQSLKRNILKGTSHSINVQKQSIRRESINQHFSNNVDSCQFKNLVKNRLIKDRNKENPNEQPNCIGGDKPSKDGPKQVKIDPRTLRETNHRFESTRSNNCDSIRSHKFESTDSKFDCGNNFQSSVGSNQFDTSIEVKSSLCKLVQDSGLKNLLNMQKVSQHQETLKDTSRFGSFETIAKPQIGSLGNIMSNSRMSNDLNAKGPFLKFSKPSQICLKQQSSHSTYHAPKIQDHSIENEKINKGMTFNHKQFAKYARTVLPSLEDVEQDSAQKQQKLIFSPIISTDRQQPFRSGYKQSEQCQVSESSELLNFKNIDMVLGQEKVCMTRAQSMKNNLGRVQKQLEINNYAQPIQKISMANNSSNINYTSIARLNSKLIHATRTDSDKTDFNSNFFKKIKGKQSQINTQLAEQQNEKMVNGSLEQGYSLRAMLDNISKTSRSIQQEHLQKLPISFPRQSESKREIHSTPNILVSGQNQSTVNNIKGNVNTIVLPNGDIYEGEINGNGQMHGNGILYSQGKSEVRFNGNFKEDKFNNGTLYNLNHFALPVDYHHIDLSRLNWTKYEGDFQGGAKTGFAKIYFAYGDRFTGSVKKDTIEGWGCFYSKTGQLISGWWKQNRFQEIKG